MGKNKIQDEIVEYNGIKLSDIPTPILQQELTRRKNVESEQLVSQMNRIMETLKSLGFTYVVDDECNCCHIDEFEILRNNKGEAKAIRYITRDVEGEEDFDYNLFYN